MELPAKGGGVITIIFHDVGRGKLCWKEEVESLSDKTLLKCIKSRHALASNTVEFYWNEDQCSGTIVVGGFRTVGTFSVQGGAKL
jgi:hypothetical protein